MLARCPEEHSGMGLTAVAFEAIGRRANLRMVWTRVNRIDPAPALADQESDAIVHLTHERLGETATRDAGLIRGDDNQVASVVQEADRFHAARQQAGARYMIDVSHFLAEGPVSIYECCAAAHDGRISSGATPAGERLM